MLYAGFTHGSIGISVPSIEKQSLRYSDVKSNENFEVAFDIWDSRRLSEVPDNRKYTVTITRGTNKLEPLVKEVFYKPGRYTVRLPISPPDSGTFVLGMTTEHGLYFEDTIWVSFSTRFFIWIKFLILIPVALFCIPLLLMRSPKH